MIKKKDRVVITFGRYQGMEGRVTTVKGNGRSAVVFFNKTLRTVTVPIKNLKLS